MSGLLALIGLVVLVFGIFAVASSRDPLGYSPPNTYFIPLIGLAMLAAGVLWRLLA